MFSNAGMTNFHVWGPGILTQFINQCVYFNRGVFCDLLLFKHYSVTLYQILVILLIRIQLERLSDCAAFVQISSLWMHLTEHLLILLSQLSRVLKATTGWPPNGTAAGKKSTLTCHVITGGMPLLAQWYLQTGLLCDLIKATGRLKGEAHPRKFSLLGSNCLVF